MRKFGKQLWLVLALGVAVAMLGGGGKVLAGLAGYGPSQQDVAAAEIRERYTKREYRIAMRDGVKLFTVVYAPKDASSAKTYPFLIERTPYSAAPYGTDNCEYPGC